MVTTHADVRQAVRQFWGGPPDMAGLPYWGVVRGSGAVAYVANMVRHRVMFGMRDELRRLSDEDPTWNVSPPHLVTFGAF